MLRLRTFGGCFLERDGVRVDAVSGQRKGLALLALVAAGGAGGVSRDVAVAYLWPDSDDERARTSLRQLVHALRGPLGEPSLFLATPELRLDPARVGSDVADFRDALARGDDAAAAALHVGPFLDGFYLRGADELERWIARERTALAKDAARALERLAERATAGGDARAAVEHWYRFANAEPLNARAALGLMRALEAAGERAAALRHAELYDALVREDTGGAPDAAVAALAERLRAAPPPSAPAEPAVTVAPVAPVAPVVPVVPAEAADPVAAPAPSPAPRRAPGPRPAAVVAAALAVVALAVGVGRASRSDGAGDTAGAARAMRRAPVPAASVAVLPFANTSGDPANEPLSDGLTDELIAALGKVPGLKVVARTSAFSLKGTRLGARAVGDTLGVATVLEASVRRAGDRVKVTAQLVSTADDAVLWTESYDRTLTDALALQEDIARAIVVALRGRLVAPADLRLARHHSADPAAVELYLRGRHLFLTRTDRDGALQAVRHFESAVRLDSTYARAHAGLSDARTRLAVFGFAPPREAFALAKASARRALALDPTLPEAHAALAHALCVADFDWRGAEREFREAIRLDAGYVLARLPFAVCLMSEGRLDEAIAQLDTARSVDPLSILPANVLGRAYVNARQPARAASLLGEVLELNPQADLAWQQLGYAYLQLRRNDDAIAAFRRAAAISGSRDSAHLAYAYAVTGRRDEGERVVRALVASGGRRYLSPYHVALAWAGLGQADSAFAWLERGYDERASFMIGVAMEPAFAPLHGDRRWRPLLARMGLDGVAGAR